MPPELEGYSPKRSAKPVRISFRMRELLTAKELDLMPHQWDEFPKDSKAEMMAVVEIDNMITGYQRDNPVED